MTESSATSNTMLHNEGSAIRLRLARESDLDAYYSSLNDPESMRLTGTHSEFTREEIAAWIRKIKIPSEDRTDFLIVLHDTDEFLGEVVLNEMDPINRSANIRIVIGTQHHGKGYGTEAMRLMLNYGFKTLKLHRIHLGVYVFNPRAVHVYEKIGFQREGMQRDVLYWEGEFHDMIMMSILEEEFLGI